MLVSTAAFATMGACSHALAGRCDWRIVAVARAAVAFAITGWLAHVRGVRVLFRWPRTLWVRSFAGSLSLLFTFYALSRLPIALAVTLFNTFPIWVAVLAWPVLGERPTIGLLVALASGVAGVVLIEQGQGGGEVAVAGIGPVRPAVGAALCAALCTAVAMLGLHRLRYVRSLAVVVHFSAVATVASTAFAVATPLLFPDRPLDWGPVASPTVLLSLAAVGGLASIGQIAMTRAFSLGRPQGLAVVGLSQVVFAFGFDLLIWNYQVALPETVGLLLILSPVAWLVGRRRA
jgi:drug/metabolite transporter (DMT)-like permease